MDEKEKKKNLADKVAYIFRKYTKNEVSNAFGFANQSSLSGWDNPLNPKIKKVHLLGLQEYFEIPITIFEDDFFYNETEMHKAIEEYKEELEKKKKEKKIFESLKKHNLVPKTIYDNEIDSMEKIDREIMEHKEKIRQNRLIFEKNLFIEDNRLYNNLKGEWNSYLYSSIYKRTGKIHIFKTYFKENYEVVDEHENRGKLFIGDNQSIVVKKTPNEKNFSVIVFQNINVSYKICRFSIISIQNGTSEEMMQHGFYSKKSYSKEEAKEILGDIDNIQLKLNLDFAKRIRDEFNTD